MSANLREKTGKGKSVNANFLIPLLADNPAFHMIDEKNDFIEALQRYVVEQLRLSSEAPDYNNEAIRIIDARNHLFCNVGCRRTDEEEGIYAIRDLCRVDDDTMEVVPDVMRFRAIAKDLF